jgi:sugar lactone lactonase YvrE
VAVDGSGNVFVADSINNTVKEILAAGGYTIVNTLGGGFNRLDLNQPAGVAVDGSGNVFVADLGNSAVKEIMTQGVNFGSAAIGTSTPLIPLTFTFDTGGTIRTPTVLTQGAAGLDFADAGTGDTCTAATYGAGGTCTLNVSFTPKFSGVRYGAATLTNSSGTVVATTYVYGTGLGPQVTFSPGTQSTLSSGFSFPMGMAVDGSGNVFVADYGNNAVKEILAAGGYAAVNPLGSGFLQPGGVAVDGSGNVFVADTFNDAVKEILAAGGYTTVKTLGSGFHIPERVAVDGSGNVFVADYGNDAVKEILAADGYTTVKTLGSGFFTPAGVAVDGSGNVFVADHGNNAVKEILAAGGYTIVKTLGSGFNQPYSVAVDGIGNVFVADTGNNAVKEILAAGGYTTVNILGNGFNQPEGVAVDSSGNVFVGDTFNNAVVKLDFADPPSLSFASTAFGSTSSDSPQTVTLTNIGNAGLTFPVPTTGLNPSIAAAFTIGNSSTCPELTSGSSPTTLFPGSSCTNLISFTPTTTGSISGSLVTTDDNLNAAAPGYVTQSIALSGTGTAGTPTVSFTVPNHTYGDAPFTVGASSNSTGAFTYTLISGPASIAGSTVTMTGAGTVVLQASEAADTNYTASTKNATFTVATITPAIAFSVPNHIYGDAPFTVGASSNSTGAFTYTVVSGPATIAGSTVTLTGAETVVLQAAEAADANYTANTKNATFTVAAITPAISFSVPNHIFGDAPFTVSAASNSTGAFVYTVVSGPATVAGTTVTLTGAGTAVLQASEAADTNYIASTKNATFTVAAITPAISFTVPSHAFGDAPFTVSATSTSTGAFTYTVVSGPATFAGSTVTLTGTGTVVLQASQAATASYAAATATTSFTVAAGFSLTSGSGIGSTFGTATVAAGAAATFTLTLSPGGAATYPDALTLSATGLPTGATATFSPVMIPAGSTATPVTLTIQTSNNQTARNEKPFSGGPLAPVTLEFFLLPLAGMKSVRRRLQQMPRLTVALVIMVMSLGSVLGLIGCGGNDVASQTAKSYTVAVTATDVTTGAHSSANVTLNVQ